MKKRIMNHPLAVARKKFSRHRAQAKYRNIQFNFDFDTWYNWWLSNSVDKNVNVKWSGSFRPCMCRYGDTGAYEPNNVYFATHPQNARDAHLHSAKPRNYVKTYRVGTTLYDRAGIKQYCAERGMKKYDYLKFRISHYEKSVYLEYDQLRRRFLYEYRPESRRRWWEGPTACHRTRSAAAADWGISTQKYVTQERKNRAGYRKHRIGNFLKYYRQNTIYPDGEAILSGKDFDL